MALKAAVLAAVRCSLRLFWMSGRGDGCEALAEAGNGEVGVSMTRVTLGGSEW